MKARTLSGPAYLMHMSVPVLSLCMIMASRAVRCETLPMRLGGLKVALSRLHTLASSASCWAEMDLTTAGESTWRSDSQRMKVLMALPTNICFDEFDSTRNSGLPSAAGA
jgi:hypothetical protein